MLRAVVEDFLTLGWHVETTLDAQVVSLGIEHPLLNVTRINSASEEAAAFESLAKQADTVIVIAPEFHNLLLNRVRRIEALSSTRHLGCSAAAIEICGDKLELSPHLIAQGIPTIATEPFDVRSPQRAWAFPIVVKPRHGAGSTLTFAIKNREQLLRTCDEIMASSESLEFIQQPLIVGRPLAMSAIGDQLLPLSHQVLSDDGRFQYLGTNLMPDESKSNLAAACRTLLRDCQAAIRGLNGYVGFDLIEPANAPGQPVLVEINPRFTSSYLAYRRACQTNVAEALLSDHTPLMWRSEAIQFRV